MSSSSATQRAAIPQAAATAPPPSARRTLAGWLHASHLSHLGIANTMRLARAYNRVKFRDQDRWRRELYSSQLPQLLNENGAPTRAVVEMKDGWAIDTSLSLPHLDRMLEESEKIIAERSGTRLSADSYRSYFQDVWKTEDLVNYPSFLDFVSSSQMLATVAHYLQCIPVLSTTLPTGIRFVESNALFDDKPNTPKDSQLYHIDYYTHPNIYMMVLLRDATPESGPFTFLPASVSRKAAQALGYWKRGKGYRVTDQEVYSVVDRKEAIEFCYPRGTVLFMDSSNCFHYGSRNAVKPRFQLMVGYGGVVRSDFSELLLPPKVYPIYPGDSRLRRMLLNKHLLE